MIDRLISFAIYTGFAVVVIHIVYGVIMIAIGLGA